MHGGQVLGDDKQGGQEKGSQHQGGHRQAGQGRGDQHQCDGGQACNHLGYQGRADRGKSGHGRGSQHQGGQGTVDRAKQNRADGAGARPGAEGGRRSRSQRGRQIKPSKPPTTNSASSSDRSRPSEQPGVLTFHDDFHPSPEALQEINESIAARTAYLKERLARLKRDDFSLSNLPPNPLHKKILEMEEKLKELHFVHCLHCDELLFDEKLTVRDQRCRKCSHEWRQAKPGQVMMWSRENDMHCTTVPPELQNLTPVEQSCCQRLFVVMKIYRLAGGALHLKGHCLTLLQDLEGFMTRLPPAPKDLPMIFLIGPGQRVSATTYHCHRCFQIYRVLKTVQNNQKI